MTIVLSIIDCPLTKMTLNLKVSTTTTSTSTTTSTTTTSRSTTSSTSSCCWSCCQHSCCCCQRVLILWVQKGLGVSNNVGIYLFPDKTSACYKLLGGLNQEEGRMMLGSGGPWAIQDILWCCFKKEVLVELGTSSNKQQI